MYITRDNLARRQHLKARSLGPQGIAIVESAAKSLWPSIAPTSDVMPVCEPTPALAPKRYTAHQRTQARERVIARTVRELDPADIRDNSNHGTLITGKGLSKPVAISPGIKLSQSEIDRRK